MSAAVGQASGTAVNVPWPQPDATDALVRRYGFDDRNLALHREALRIGEREREVLQPFAGWAQSVAHEVAKALCEWQFNAAANVRLVEEIAAVHGVQAAMLRSRFETAAAGCFVEVFAGAAVNWDSRYFEKRLRMADGQAGLPLRWYVAFYGELRRVMAGLLRRDIADDAAARQIESAASKIFDYDLEAIADSLRLQTVHHMLQASGIAFSDISGDRDQAASIPRTAQAFHAQIETLGREMKRMSEEHGQGDIDVRMDSAGLLGEFRAMALAVNEMVAGHITVKKKAMACVAEFARGNFDAPLDRFAGKKAFINDNIEHLRSNVKRFIQEMVHMSDEHNRGDIDALIPAETFEGSFGVMAQGVNEMVAGHITVKKKAMACIAEFGKGNFRATLERFPGKKAFINETIEEMRTNLSGLISAAAQNASALAGSSEELTAVSQQMASNAEETATQANVVSAASEQVSRSVAAVAAAAEEMQASIGEIARSANESARVAGQAVSVAGATNETIRKLSDSSQEIGNVIKVITSIAQQTNLLALNATIEAARAGEAGKGFAVVANEVKELAKQTAKATGEIGHKIEAIQGDTRGAIQAIGEISGIIGQINDISGSIASAVEEQTVTTNEIGRSVTEAASGVADIARNISSVAAAAQDTTRGVHETRKASLELSRMAAELQTNVSRFTI
jgi:methyl-accepting chemotaxis protein